MQKLVLKKGEDRRLRTGHLWVFSNEVRDHPVAAAGDVVEVVTAGGQSLGSAIYHPHSLISARLLAAEVESLNAGFFIGRIEAALKLREAGLPGEACYRLVHGESDFLPGLVVDRYYDHLVVQTLCAGMDRFQSSIVEALKTVLEPVGVVERNDTGLRGYEELEQRRGILFGDWSGPIRIEENGLRFQVDLLQGQKTGFFLDQKLNRRAVGAVCPDRKVLDCFCNSGGFALHACRAGAVSVVAADSSAPALEMAAENERLNELSGIEWKCADAFDLLGEYASSGRRFDVVILDPPSFVRRRKDLPAARKAYRRLNELGLRCLEPGGLLVTASCSHHFPEAEFLETVNESGQRAGVRLQLLERRGAGPDHPVLPAMPETGYLKLMVFRAGLVG
jgi:23S rRNA (cytosine1962-C5)-methyltransferase